MLKSLNLVVGILDEAVPFEVLAAPGSHIADALVPARDHAVRHSSASV